MRWSPSRACPASWSDANGEERQSEAAQPTGRRGRAAQLRCSPAVIVVPVVEFEPVVRPAIRRRPPARQLVLEGLQISWVRAVLQLPRHLGLLCLGSAAPHSSTSLYEDKRA